MVFNVLTLIYLNQHFSYNYIILPFKLVLINWKPNRCAALPRWVYRVNSCPDPNNINKWIEASKRLNCLHNLNSSNPSDDGNVYHCLPSSFLNETIEYCNRNTVIPPGSLSFFLLSLFLYLSLPLSLHIYIYIYYFKCFIFSFWLS